jgi:hypothetical protein
MTPDSTGGQLSHLSTLQPLGKSLPFDPPAPTPPQDPDEPRRVFLQHFEPQRRSGIANLFHFSIRDHGCTTARQVCSQVWQTVHRRTQYANDPETATHLAHVLVVMQHDQTGALAYAQSVLEYEQLPYEARQRVKTQRAAPYIHAAMQGKDVTAPQLAMLRRLGYEGTVPRDRAEASVLIDELMRGRGEL